MGSDGSPGSFTPSLGSCLGLSCFDLLVAQLERARPGFEWPNKTADGSIVVKCTFTLYGHFFRQCGVSLLHHQHVWIICLKNKIAKPYLKVEKDRKPYIANIVQVKSLYFMQNIFLLGNKFQMGVKSIRYGTFPLLSIFLRSSQVLFLKLSCLSVPKRTHFIVTAVHSGNIFWMIQDLTRVTYS